jgi:chemotaxis protein CheX
MSSPQSTGTLAISFSESAILGIAKSILFEELEEIDDVVTDLVGELTNMVAGSAKQILDEKGYDFGLATPMVFTRRSKSIPHVENQPVYMVPMESASGKMFVEICFSA